MGVNAVVFAALAAGLVAGYAHPAMLQRTFAIRISIYLAFLTQSSTPARSKAWQRGPFFVVYHSVSSLKPGGRQGDDSCPSIIFYWW